MKLRKLPSIIVLFTLASANVATAQLVIDNANLFLEAGATVTVQVDITSNTNIQGPGKILLKGTSNQNVNMGGFTIPNLEMDNASNVTLTGSLKIGSSLLFTNGKIIAGANNITLAEVATVTGQGTGKFVETNGTGQLVKTLTADVASLELPLGAGTNYRPVFVSSTGTYSNANVGVRVLAAADPNMPPKISDYVSTHWAVTKTGVTGTVSVAGQYLASDVTGT